MVMSAWPAATERVSSTRLHTCMGCTWHRDVIAGKEAGDTVIDHRVYGKVTIRQAAEQDVKDHNCKQHRQRMAWFRFVWECAKAKGLM